MMARRGRFRGAKATPKKLERELLDKSLELAKEPSLLIPKCTQKCKKCDFDKILSKMEKVQRYSDDANRLQALAMRGDQLVRAYAATISLAAAGKIPFLAAAKLPTGEISYAVRGKVDKEKLMGVQHYDDPDIRLLAYWDIARKRDIHLYSTEKQLVCSSDPNPPPEYVREMIARSPYDLDKEGGCGHEAMTYLVVKWKSVDRTVRVCSECLKEVNLVQSLVSRLAARDPTDDFEVDVDHDFEYLGEDCDIGKDYSMPPSLSSEYLSDEIDDTTLVKRYIEGKLDHIRASGVPIYIIGEQCYGRDVESFLARIRGSEVEKEAIANLIESKGIPVVSDSDLAGRIIAGLWRDHESFLLDSVAEERDFEIARKSVKDDSPSALLKEAHRIHMNREVHSSLPSYTKLGEMGDLADTMARTYKTEGKEATLRAIEKVRSRGHRMRAVDYAFISALGEADSKAWQFTSEEKDFGEYLSQFATRLLEAEGEEYHDSLKVLVDACGAVEEIVRSD
jgi:hypothetical protein